VSEKPWVYIASPYTKGDPAINARAQCELWEELMSDGIVWPFAPLWSHFQHTIFPRPYEDWTAYDNAILPRMDACIRMSAHYQPMSYWQHESKGADNEVHLFRQLEKPVFICKQALYAWCKERPQE
jgi:hypothetical protein